MPDTQRPQPEVLRDPLGQQINVGDIVVWAKSSFGAGVAMTLTDGELKTSYYRVTSVKRHVSMHLLLENMELAAGKWCKTSVPPHSLIKVNKILGIE